MEFLLLNFSLKTYSPIYILQKVRLIFVNKLYSIFYSFVETGPLTVAPSPASIAPSPASVEPSMSSVAESDNDDSDFIPSSLPGKYQ